MLTTHTFAVHDQEKADRLKGKVNKKYCLKKSGTQGLQECQHYKTNVAHT